MLNPTQSITVKLFRYICVLCLCIVAGLNSLAQNKFAIEAKDTLVQNKADLTKMLSFFKEVKSYQNDSGHFEYDASMYLSYASSGLQWAQEKGTEWNILESKFYKLRYSFDVGNYDDGFVLANDLLASQTFQEDRRITRVTSYVKNMYLKLNAYSQLLQFYPTYDRMNRKHGRTISKSDYINDAYLATAYYGQKNYTEAAVYYKRASHQSLKNDNLFWAATQLNNAALCHKYLNEWDSANAYFNLALFQLNQLKQKNIKPQDYEGAIYLELVVKSNKADYFVFQGQPAKALPFYFKELEASRQKKQNLISTSAYYNIAQVYYLTQQYEKTQQYIDSALLFDPRFNEYTLKAIDLRGRCYAAQGQIEKANLYFTRAQEVRDSVEQNRIKNNYVAATTQFDLARKESDLAMSEQRVKSEKQRNRIALIGLALLAVFSLLLFMYYKRAKRDKVVIASQKLEAEKEAQEKSLLLKEVHHRVKNNLQVISGLLDLQRSKKEEVSFDYLVDETQKYIHSMSLVHEMLYQKDQLMRVNMQEYFSKLATFSASSQPKKNVRINVLTEGAKLQLDKATPLGLILTELISNSYKHGFKNEAEGIIDIQLEAKGNEYLFTYSDNGVGLPENFSAATTRSLGFRLIRMFAEEMNAELSLGKEEGFALSLDFGNA